MKRKNFVSALIALCLAGLIATGSVGCIVTGFRLTVADWTHLISLTLLFSLLAAAAFQLRWGSLLVTVVGVFLLSFLVRRGDLLQSAEKLLNHITQLYNNAYGWGYLRWSETDLSTVRPDTALTVIACTVSAAVCWTVLRRKWFGFGLLAGLLPLLCCCVVTDTVPRTEYIWMLVTALLLLTLTQRLRRLRPWDANRLTAWLLIPVMLLSTAAIHFSGSSHFPLQPQQLQNALLNLGTYAADWLPGGFIEIPGSHGSVTVGRVELTNAGPISLGDTPVMYVTGSLNGRLYLRGQAYDRYTGSGWECTLDTKNEGGWPVSKTDSGMHIRIETIGTDALRYFPYYICDPDWQQELTYGYLSNPQGLQEYSFGLIDNSTNRKPTFDPLSADDRATYLSLPESTAEAAQALLGQLGIFGSDQVTAQAIAAYVSQCADYDTNTAAMGSQGEDFAIWFLTRSETGYCVHFATAATVLLRAAGIPARYVTGYMTSVMYNKTCVVREDQAHAWVEYFDSNKGWTMLEATPGEVTPPQTAPPETTVPTEPTVPTESTPPTESTAPTESAPSLPTRPTESTAPTDTVPTRPTVQSEPTDPSQTVPAQSESAPELTEPIPTAPEEPLYTQLNLKWIRGIFWLAAIWLLIAGQYRLRIRLRRKRLQKASPNRQALKQWHYARSVSRASGLSAAELLPLAEKAAFSQHTITQEELAQFDSWLKKANAVLLHKPWLIQFFLRLIFAIE